MYSGDGKLLSLSPVPECKGFLSVAVRVPSIYGNMCGWFREITTSPFGDIQSQRIWVELADGQVKISTGPRSGKCLRNISCDAISDVEEIMYDKLEISIEALKLTVLSTSESLPNENLVWGWANDKERWKGRWREALVRTHGSGFVATAEKDIDAVKATESTKLTLWQRIEED